MDAFNPEDWGYKASEVQPFDRGWIIAPLNLPVIATDADGLWYCPIYTGNIYAYPEKIKGNIALRA